jgi:hypothetical protein
MVDQCNWSRNIQLGNFCSCLVSAQAQTAYLRDSFGLALDRAGILALGFAYFVWMNVSFLTKEGPVGRVELWLLLLVEAEAVIIFTIILLAKVFSIYTKNASERYVKLLESIGTSYKKPVPINETTLETPEHFKKI